MIRRAIGLGLLILIMKFLVPSVLGAVEKTLVSLLNVVQDVGINISSLPAQLAPKFPAR